MNIQQKIVKLQTKLASYEEVLDKQVWTVEETSRYGNKGALEVEIELVEVSIQLCEIQLFLKKPFDKWTAEEKEEHVDKDHLREKEKELLEKEKELRKEKRFFQLKPSSGGSPTSLNSNQALDKFAELAGVQVLSEDEENIMIMYFPEYFRLLKRDRLSVKAAKHLYNLIKTTLKSETIKSVRWSHKYVFGKSIDTGGGKTILQKVYSLKTGGFLCAKVFLDVVGSYGSHSAVSEYQLSKLVASHENICPIVDSIQFSHQSGSKEPLMALMMPLYSWSLAELLVCFREDPLPFDLFKQIALGLLAAGAAFEAKSLSHCDIKPSNIMMNGFVPVVIDFGAVVSLGQSTVEHTLFYSLDAKHDAVTPEFDLFCIVTTLVCCFAKFELESRTKQGMIFYIETVCSNNDMLNAYGKICLTLLNCSSSSEGLGCIQSD